MNIHKTILTITAFTALGFASLFLATPTYANHEGDNEISLDVDSQNNISQTNEADIVNNVNVEANTGGNEIDDTTKGDTSIETGDADTNVSISNDVNQNTAEVTSGPFNFSLSIEGSGDNDINFDFNNTTNIEQRNTASITNDVNVEANTGDNNIDDTTWGDASIETGDADTNVKIENEVNRNVAKINQGGMDIDLDIKGDDHDSDKYRSHGHDKDKSKDEYHDKKRKDYDKDKSYDYDHDKHHRDYKKDHDKDVKKHGEKDYSYHYGDKSYDYDKDNRYHDGYKKKHEDRKKDEDARHHDYDKKYAYHHDKKDNHDKYSYDRYHEKKKHEERRDKKKNYYDDNKYMYEADKHDKYDKYGDKYRDYHDDKFNLAKTNYPDSNLKKDKKYDYDKKDKSHHDYADKPNKGKHDGHSYRHKGLALHYFMMMHFAKKHQQMMHNYKVKMQAYKDKMVDSRKSKHGKKDDYGHNRHRDYNHVKKMYSKHYSNRDNRAYC